MRKRVILAFLLVIALVAATGCSLIVKDAEVDKQTTIIEVAGKTYTKGEVTNLVDANLQYMASMYSMYGGNYDVTNADVISSMRDNVINMLVEDAVTQAKATELGMDAFTDEELAAMQTEAETTYQGYVDSVKASEFANTELTGEALDAAVAAKMVEQGYPTVESLVKDAKTTAAGEKLRAEVVKDVTVAEEDVKADYDAKVESAKAEYEASPAAYGTAVTNGTTTYYVPAGYRYVKHILRTFTEEDSAKITDLNSQLSSAQTQLSNVEASLADLGEDASADDEPTAQQRKELTDTQTALNAQIADLQTQLDAAKEAGYAALQPTVEEIQGKIAAGEDFDALMEQYGQDPGMQREPAKTVGYPVSAASSNWVTEFRDAAMALSTVEAVSEPVRSANGIHIIKYISDAAEGAVAYDTVKEGIQSALLSAKQDELYNSTVAQWVTDAKAKIYKDRLN